MILGVVGVLALLMILVLSLLITRLATVALSMTGLSYEVARFQARSAFTGTGFTTSEAESITGHPVRRRIVMGLMILRSAGLVTVLLSLVLSFVGPGSDVGRLLRLVGLVFGVTAVLLVLRSDRIQAGLERLFARILNRWTELDIRDYARLLKLSGDYTVMEVDVANDEWLAGKALSECDLPNEGVTVLGIYRDDGEYVGAPRGGTEVYVGDTLILYGRSAVLQELSERRGGAAGDEAHDRAVSEQRRHLARQAREEHAQQRRKQRQHMDDEDEHDPEPGQAPPPSHRPQENAEHA